MISGIVKILCKQDSGCGVIDIGYLSEE